MPIDFARNLDFFSRSDTLLCTFLGLPGDILGKYTNISTLPARSRSERIEMNFNFVVVAVALTGLFGFAFVIFGIFHSRSRVG